VRKANDVSSDIDFEILTSAYKHGIDDESMLSAIANPIWSYFYSERTVALVIGFDKNGDTIEVAYDIASRHIFHARPVNRSGKRKR
jgi:hypothetical protein